MFIFIDLKQFFIQTVKERQFFLKILQAKTLKQNQSLIRCSNESESSPVKLFKVTVKV